MDGSCIMRKVKSSTLTHLTLLSSGVQGLMKRRLVSLLVYV